WSSPATATGARYPNADSWLLYRPSDAELSCLRPGIDAGGPVLPPLRDPLRAALHQLRRRADRRSTVLRRLRAPGRPDRRRARGRAAPAVRGLLRPGRLDGAVGASGPGGVRRAAPRLSGPCR